MKRMLICLFPILVIAAAGAAAQEYRGDVSALERDFDFRPSSPLTVRLLKP